MPPTSAPVRDLLADGAEMLAGWADPGTVVPVIR